MPATPSIKPLLSGDDWMSRFDEHILAAGKKLAKPRLVAGLRLETLDDGYLLTGSVDDEATAEVEVSFWAQSGGLAFDTDCSCSFGSFCAHAAALLFAAAKKSTLERLLKGGSNQVLPVDEASAPEPQRPELTGLTPTFHLAVDLEPATSRPVQLLLQALRTPERKVWLVARPTVRYGDHDLPLLHDHSRPDVVETPGGGEAVVKRDPVAERNAIETLIQLGLTNLAAHPSYRFLLGMARKDSGGEAEEANAWFPEPSLSTPDVFWPWFRAEASAKLRAAGWEVTIADDIGYVVYPVEPEEWKTTLEELPNGWFSLSVGFEVDGQRLDLLPILAKLLEENIPAQIADLPDTARHLIYLPDGAALHVPVGRLRNILHHLSALVDPSQPLLHPLDAATLMEDSDLPIDPSPTLAKLAKRLRGRAGAPQEADPPPPGLLAELRPYQLAGFHWMRFLADHALHGILADDMGLGKTMQTLAHILAERDSGRNEGKPALVVAPTSVVPNWKAEAAKFAPSLNVLVLQGAKRRKLFNTIPHADLVLTSYALLQRDITLLKKVGFHLVVLDEAQYIKNPTAKVAKAACELQCTTRLCLSGTPVENHLGELWSLMRFLIPGFLGTRKAFRAAFQNPIEKEEDEERQQLLKARLAPLILRRTKDQVAPELPPKTILTHPIELTTGQKDLYETVRATMDTRVRDAIAAQGLQQSRMVFLDALLKLRQICCEPRLLKEEVPGINTAELASAKLDYFTDLVDTLLEEGRRILVFSQFTSMLALIERELRQRDIPYLLLTGNSKDRGKLVETFQSGTIPLFLISLKAGGTGLNLTAADTVIHYDPWWNPAAEAQATDRAYRIGQKNPVFVHKLICTGTVEERIQALQASKTELAESLLANTNHPTTPDPETLRQLLAPLV